MFLTNMIFPPSFYSMGSLLLIIFPFVYHTPPTKLQTNGEVKGNHELQKKRTKIEQTSLAKEKKNILAIMLECININVTCKRKRKKIRE